MVGFHRLPLVAVFVVFWSLGFSLPREAIITIQQDGVPPRPEGLDDGYFHTIQFQNLETIDYAPAVDAMPVWLYSRTQKILV